MGYFCLDSYRGAVAIRRYGAALLFRSGIDLEKAIGARSYRRSRAGAPYAVAARMVFRSDARCLSGPTGNSCYRRCTLPLDASAARRLGRQELAG